MGWMNHVFIGPELHRYHHSADFNEAVNQGATLSLFDVLGMLRRQLYFLPYCVLSIVGSEVVP